MSRLHFRAKACALFALALTVTVRPSLGQAVRTPSHSAVPYSGQLRADPAVGNLQGIQRYGRPLRTDPDEGEGYSYHVYPVAAAGDRTTVDRAANKTEQPDAAMLADEPMYRPGPVFPFDSTVGLRRPAAPGGFGTLMDAALGTKQAVSHQPLIQVKVRVIEVQRSNSMSVSSVLDYVSKQGVAGSSLISGNNLNANMANLRGSSRFAVPGLIGLDSTGKLNGSGLLVNLTSEHINYIASFIATELHGDIVTAPEVVTLNGQNVEFVAGAKVPFEIGQNVVVDNTNNIQQFFYKHVGTYISVTPQIVHWTGARGRASNEGSSRIRFIPISPEDVRDWPVLLTALSLDKQLWPLFSDSFQDMLELGTPPDDDFTKARVLKELNDALGKTHQAIAPNATIDRPFLAQRLQDSILLPWPLPSAACSDCNWKPNDCTIDLAIVVRLSGTGTANVSTPDREGNVVNRSVTLEDNVRAIANIVQVKSGEGVVMAGLIGERDVKAVSKVPVLGDIPVVGALFRSKQADRVKTETLIFVEAKVLDQNPCIARGQSHDDFQLAKPYLNRDLLDNPLEYGMYRAGFGTYLPPHSHDEQVFWERFGRKVRRAATELDDFADD